MVEEENGSRLSLNTILTCVPNNQIKEKDILESPEAECLLKHIEDKLKKKRDYKILFTGGTGTGKSYGGTRLLELHYIKRFNEPLPEKHIVSDLSEAILRVKDFKRIGEGLLIEEISTSVGSRDSNTTQNKMWNKFLDTCRIKQVVLVMNAPHISFCDKHIRMSLDSWVDCKLVDFKRGIVVGSPLWLQTSPHKPEPYKHHYENEDGTVIDTIYFKKPSEKISKFYDEQKKEFTDELYDEIYLRMSKDRQEKLKKLGAKFLAPRELEAYELYLKGYTSKEGAKKMGYTDYRHFNEVLKMAKDKLKTSDYAYQCKKLDKLGEIGAKKNMGTGKELTFKGMETDNNYIEEEDVIDDV